MPTLTVIADQLLAPVPGGTGRYTRELLRAMAVTVPQDWELTSVISNGDPELATVPGVRGPRVLRLSRRALIAAWELGLPLWPGGDSVHAMTPLAPPAPRRGRRLVVTVHDAVPWTHPETLTRRGVSWHRRVIARAAEFADALVVPTGAVAAELGQHVDITTHTHVVSEGVTAALLATEDGAALDLPPKYVLAIGTIEPRKGYEYLIRALAQPDAPQVPLLIIGQPGWGAIDPIELATEHGLPRDRVRVLGNVTDGELAAILRNASVLAAPSLAEGFGLPVVEAMAVGVPVVHSDAPALVEVAGGAGVQVPRGDVEALASALRKVLDDPAGAAELSEVGRIRTETFTWERAARAVWRIHQDLW